MSGSGCQIRWGGERKVQKKRAAKSDSRISKQEIRHKGMPAKVIFFSNGYGHIGADYIQAMESVKE
jgi:hypothetical protein